MYVFDTAIFFTQKNILIVALSTCEKGTNPRQMWSFCATSNIIETFGKPVNIDFSDNEKTLLYCDPDDNNKPFFVVMTLNEENSSYFYWEFLTLLLSHCLSLKFCFYTLRCNFTI